MKRWLLILLLPVLARAGTFTIAGDAAGYACDETFMSAANPTFNYGVTTTMQLARAAAANDSLIGLIWFPGLDDSMRAIGTVTSWDSARLTFIYSTTSLDASDTVMVWLAVLRRQVDEGTGNGAASGDGATWNTYDGATTWTTGGCGSNATDFNETRLSTDSIKFSDNRILYAADSSVWVRIPGTHIADTVGSGTGGMGWKVIYKWRDGTEAANNKITLRASDHADTDGRPKLQVWYTEYVAPPTTSSSLRTNSTRVSSLR